MLLYMWRTVCSMKIVNWLYVIILWLQEVIPVFWCKACRSHKIYKGVLGNQMRNGSCWQVCSFFMQEESRTHSRWIVWKWYKLEMGRFRLAWRGHVRLQIAPSLKGPSLWREHGRVGSKMGQNQWSFDIAQGGQLEDLSD